MPPRASTAGCILGATIPTRPRYPKREHGRELRPPTDVDAYPRGASPRGVMDLVGNVWQWTDEYLDEHTRAAVLRGGSYYRPGGSGWYFPGTRDWTSTPSIC